MAVPRAGTKGEGVVRERKKGKGRRRERGGGGGEEEGRDGGLKQGSGVGPRKLLTSSHAGRQSDHLLKGSTGETFVPPRRYPDWVAGGGRVERFDVGKGGGGVARERAHKVSRAREPVVMTSSGVVRALTTKWTFGYLSRTIRGAGEEVENGALAAAGDEEDVEVLCSMDGANRFVRLDGGKNVYGSFYHVREPETIGLGDVTTFGEFVDCAKKWKQKHVHARVPLMRRKDASGEDAAGLQEHYRRIMSPETMPELTPICGSPLRRDLMGSVDWSWMISYLGAQNFGSIRDVHLHCGTRNSLHHCKYENIDRLLVQVRGRTRVLLLDPSLAFEGLYPYPVHHPYDGYSMVDFEAEEDANKSLWPLFGENVRGKECILEPGEVLYVPQYFFLHRQDLDEEVVALDVSVSQGKRTRHRAAIPLQISRLLEERVSELESIRDAHHWLSVIAHGEESEWIDTSTVKGHSRIKFVESVYEEVEENLGKGQVPAFLKAMVEGRLMPTPWLNKKEFREPLYLLDKPFTLEDTRTELEKKYPEFFRNKLKGEGWQVPESRSTVPIPGYNMPANADYRTYSPSQSK
ncbi:JmjC domain-containing protein [Chloropicon primus]|nr:JmjC domain-containing protein [Chloropicon primus]